MTSPVTASPLKTVFDSVGPQHEKALKQAFYNTAAIIFVCISGAVTVSAYYVLEAFLRPLIWAALCGTFLFPFKRALTQLVRCWLKDLEEQHTPFIVGVTVLPFKGLSKSSDVIGSIMKANYKLMLSIFVLVPFCYVLVVFHPFYQIFFGVKFAVNILVTLLELFNNPLAVWSIFVGYIILIFFYKKSSITSSFNDIIMKNISMAVWIMILFHFASLAGPWKIPLSLILFVLIGLGVVGEKRSKNEQISHEHNSHIGLSVKGFVDITLSYLGISESKVFSSNNHGTLSRTSSVASIPDPQLLDDDTANNSANPQSLVDHPKALNPTIETLKSTPVIKKSSTKLKKSGHQKRKRIGSSDPYFIALFWLFMISRFWIHTWLFQLLILFVFVYMLKVLYTQVGLGNVFEAKFAMALTYCHRLYLERQDIILPGPVKGVIYMMHSGDQKVICWMNRALDKLMSVFIILCLCILAIMGAAFFAVQVHHESSYLVNVVTDVVNKTVISNQDYLRLLNVNDSDIRKTVDDAVHSAYMVGRKKMADFVSVTFANQQGGNDALTEEQITQFLDQIYDSWMGKKNIDDELNTDDNIKDNTEIDDKSHQTFLLQKWRKITTSIYGSDMTNVIEMLKENIHTLQSIVDSLWTILKGNVNLVFSIITHVFSIILFSGTYLLNAIISIIIFATTLFYLLNASSDKYLLLEVLSTVSMGTRLGESVNNAIQDVFGASLKMATFYGFYTWLTHSVFGANLIFIPAAFAATLGVVPFIGTYWAAVPATLEIWLLQQDGFLAALLFVLHMLPTYVVDTAIYTEIGGGGHPYLTGLAVAGGIYCIGLEGAFVGPIVLCCLIAAFNIFNGIMNAADDEMDGNDGNFKTKDLNTPFSRLRRAMSEDRYKK